MTSLQILNTHLSPYVQVLGRLSVIIEKYQLNRHSLINILYRQWECDRSISTSESGKFVVRILQFLLNGVLKPFNEILFHWLFHGELVHNHDFFVRIVQGHKLSSTPVSSLMSSTWDHMFKLESRNVPDILSSVAHHILEIGRNLNILRRCMIEDGIEPSSIEVVPIPKDKQLIKIGQEKECCEYIMNLAQVTTHKIVLFILTGRYSNSMFASAKRHNLSSCLAYIHDIMLCGCGDWLNEFIHSSYEELEKIKDIRADKLHTLFMLSLAQSSFTKGIGIDEEESEESPTTLFRAIVSPHSFRKMLNRILSVSSGSDPAPYVIDSPLSEVPSESISSVSSRTHCGYELFSLKFIPPFPSSLLFTSTTLYKYELLFRRMWVCRLVEERLSIAWMECMRMRKMCITALRTRGHTPTAISSYAGAASKLSTSPFIVLIQTILSTMSSFFRSVFSFFSYSIIDTNFNTLTKGLNVVERECESRLGWTGEGHSTVSTVRNRQAVVKSSVGMGAVNMTPYVASAGSSSSLMVSLKTIEILHTRFLDAVLRGCLLTNAKHAAQLDELCHRAMLFSNQCILLFMSMRADTISGDALVEIIREKESLLPDLKEKMKGWKEGVDGLCKVLKHSGEYEELVMRLKWSNLYE
ncbi:Gamma-tubulin complex component protein like protein [Aduncisulcus paluster]|uniref:Gamma-tubulin complex component protein like protein n=1 Tax=Aduncisulcus paluster TaxID=2918883 RepID=A0ABQ5KKC2_9EUKA|nr:Gamma-tubulin complex component protein like protein [Aduncisulcus paluster]